MATIWLAITYILPLADVLKDPKVDLRVEVFLLRLSMVDPTSFGVVYSIKQFSHDRKLYEKYAFKAIATYSAESSVATLSRSLDGHDGDDKDTKIVDFAMNIFTSIYKEPVEPIRDKWILRSANKLIDLMAEVNQSVGEIRKDVDKLADNLPSDKNN